MKSISHHDERSFLWKEQWKVEGMSYNACDLVSTSLIQYR